MFGPKGWRAREKAAGERAKRKLVSPEIRAQRAAELEAAAARARGEEVEVVAPVAEAPEVEPEVQDEVVTETEAEPAEDTADEVASVAEQPAEEAPKKRGRPRANA
jgi:hypothetical protein